MDRSCPVCGLRVGVETSCPYCGSRLIAVNLRRTMLWLLVVEEYLLLMVVGMRFG
jgi:hypothetical protein